MAVDPAPEDLGDELPPDPAASSAATDPLPGTKRPRGRPPGSTNRRPSGPLSPAQLEQRRAAAKSGAARVGRTGPTDAQLKESIVALYGMTGFGLGWIDPEIGQTLAECSSTAAEAWVRLGQQNPAVRRVLVQITTAGAASELFVAHSPLVALMVARLTSRNIITVPADAGANGAPFMAPPPFTG